MPPIAQERVVLTDATVAIWWNWVKAHLQMEGCLKGIVFIASGLLFPDSGHFTMAKHSYTRLVSDRHHHGHESVKQRLITATAFGKQEALKAKSLFNTPYVPAPATTFDPDLLARLAALPLPSDSELGGPSIARDFPTDEELVQATADAEATRAAVRGSKGRGDQATTSAARNMDELLQAARRHAQDSVNVQNVLEQQYAMRRDSNGRNYEDRVEYAIGFIRSELPARYDQLIIDTDDPSELVLEIIACCITNQSYELPTLELTFKQLKRAAGETVMAYLARAKRAFWAVWVHKGDWVYQKQFISALLNGLPEGPEYAYLRSANSCTNQFSSLLLVTEAIENLDSDIRRSALARAAIRKEAAVHTAIAGHAAQAYAPPVECTAYGNRGHSEEACWVKHPEQAPAGFVFRPHINARPKVGAKGKWKGNRK